MYDWVVETSVDNPFGLIFLYACEEEGVLIAKVDWYQQEIQYDMMSSRVAGGLHHFIASDIVVVCVWSSRLMSRLS